jgi:hypothetical protein
VSEHRAGPSARRCFVSALFILLEYCAPPPLKRVHLSPTQISLTKRSLLCSSKTLESPEKHKTTLTSLSLLSMHVVVMGFHNQYFKHAEICVTRPMVAVWPHVPLLAKHNLSQVKHIPANFFRQQSNSGIDDSNLRRTQIASVKRCHGSDSHTLALTLWFSKFWNLTGKGTEYRTFLETFSSWTGGAVRRLLCHAVGNNSSNTCASDD